MGKSRWKGSKPGMGVGRGVRQQGGTNSEGGTDSRTDSEMVRGMHWGGGVRRCGWGG